MTFPRVVEQRDLLRHSTHLILLAFVDEEKAKEAKLSGAF